jgi:hypothetical protein
MVMAWSMRERRTYAEKVEALLTFARLGVDMLRARMMPFLLRRVV